jgi:hypothetical protein
VTERIAAARRCLLEEAENYALEPDPETWREVCRAKARLDALLRCAR